MKFIEKIVKSTVEPNQTDFLWIDISGQEPVMKVYVNGIWKQITTQQ